MYLLIAAKKLDGVIARRALPDEACVLCMPDLTVRDEIAGIQRADACRCATFAALNIVSSCLKNA